MILVALGPPAGKAPHETSLDEAPFQAHFFAGFKSCLPLARQVMHGLK